MSLKDTTRHSFSTIIVCPAKYRRKVFTKEVEDTLKDACMGIEERFEIHFVEIGADEDHVHFLTQSLPVFSPQRIVQVIKSITAKEIFRLHPEVRKKLWGGKFWTSGYYANTVGQYGNEKAIKEYVLKQGRTYHQIHRGQLTLFDL
jgi:REP element-mobilizing transposase RayT